MQVQKKLLIIFFLCCFFSCGKPGSGSEVVTPPTPTAPFAKGADISWLTEMEGAGRIFYNSSGTATECIQLLKSLGTNSIRLRVWVDPAGGCCNTADVVAKAV